MVLEGNRFICMAAQEPGPHHGVKQKGSFSCSESQDEGAFISAVFCVFFFLRISTLCVVRSWASRRFVFRRKLIASFFGLRPVFSYSYIGRRRQEREGNMLMRQTRISTMKGGHTKHIRCCCFSPKFPSNIVRYTQGTCDGRCGPAPCGEEHLALSHLYVSYRRRHHLADVYLGIHIRSRFGVLRPEMTAHN